MMPDPVHDLGSWPHRTDLDTAGAVAPALILNHAPSSKACRVSWSRMRRRSKSPSIYAPSPIPITTLWKFTRELAATDRSSRLRPRR